MTSTSSIVSKWHDAVRSKLLDWIIFTHLLISALVESGPQPVQLWIDESRVVQAFSILTAQSILNLHGTISF